MSPHAQSSAPIPSWCRHCNEIVERDTVIWKYGSVPHCPHCGGALIVKG
jgi:hypothetical protein